MDEQFLFPFESVCVGSSILIYGAGELGQSYAKQIVITNYCHIIGFVDKNYKNYTNTSIPIYAPNDIHELDFDYVVVALKNSGSFPEIRRILYEQGVQEKKIIFVGKRLKSSWKFLLEEDNSCIDETLAWNYKSISVALFLLTAVGGLFFIKRFILELVRLIPDCKIDIYTTHLGNAIHCFYSDIQNINFFVQNLGVKYVENREKYDLAIQISSTGFLTVDVFKPDSFSVQYPDFMQKVQILQERIKNDGYSDSMPRIVLFQNRRFQKQNAYTSFNYGVFNIRDKKVPIPFDLDAAKRFETLKLGKYITVNYGNGSCKDGSKIAKMWPLQNFNMLVTSFKRQYPDISVVQLGISDAERIDGVDRYIFGEPFELVIHILRNSMLHIDIEGGLVHLATQLGTKCAVLFGPTPEFYYGYEENINIKAGDCHDCCGVYMDSNRCARGMKEPECMYSITPEMVMENIDKYLMSIL